MSAGVDLKDIAQQFQVYGQYLGAEPYGSGHINDTYRATFDEGGTLVHVLIQRINHVVFKDPPAVMQNICRVTDHIRSKLNGEPDITRRVLTVIPCRNGTRLHQDPIGNFWRSYIFIERAQTFDCVQSPAQAYQAAYAYGRFQSLLTDLPAPRLNETIPDFHNTPKRFEALEQAIEEDPVRRAASAKPEIEFALARKPIVSRLIELQERGEIPERITHNDTKFNNVLLDELTGDAVCVVDLDTVMPGQALYDFGDMVRTTTSPAEEDEQDLSRVEMKMPMFEALVRGYLDAAGGFLSRAERENLAFSGKLITFEIGIRFLTDYLRGDEYFRIHRPEHNLDRCRTQLKLVASIEQQEESMARRVESLAAVCG